METYQATFHARHTWWCHKQQFHRHPTVWTVKSPNLQHKISSSCIHPDTCSEKSSKLSVYYNVQKTHLSKRYPNDSYQIAPHPVICQISLSSTHPFCGFAHDILSHPVPFLSLFPDLQRLREDEGSLKTITQFTHWVNWNRRF